MNTKCRLLILAILINVSAMVAQPGFQWVHDIGGNDSMVKIVLKATADAAGNVYAVGYYHGTIDFNPSTAVYNLSSKGGRDGFIVKYQSNGNFVWARGFGGSKSDSSFTVFDQANSIVIDANGDVVVGGRFEDTCFFYTSTTTVAMQVGFGLEDAVVAKYNSSGSLQFAKVFGGTSTDRLESLDVDQNGNIYICGYFYDTIDLDPDTGVLSYNSFSGWLGPEADIFISKLSSIGHLVWGYKLGGLELDYATSIDVTNDGHFYLTGTFARLADFDPNPLGFHALQTISDATSDQDVFVAKYDTNATYLWARHMGGSGSQMAYSVKEDANGNVYSGGWYGGTPDVYSDSASVVLKTLNQSGINDAFLIKYNGQGQFQWANSMGGPGSDVCKAIAIDASNNIYVCGSFYSFNMDMDPSTAVHNLHLFNTAVSNNSDIFIGKYSDAGDYIWANNFGGVSGSVEDAYCIAIAPNSNAILMGGTATATDMDFDLSSLVSNFVSVGYSDGFIVKFSACKLGLSIAKDSSDMIADPGYAAYQWFDCHNDSLIPGATTNVYHPTVNGSYACIITGSVGCVDTTACFPVNDIVECTYNNTVLVHMDTLIVNVNDTAATYQWVVCPSYSPISTNGNSANYKVLMNSTYACIIHFANGCKDTTNCITFNGVGLEEFSHQDSFMLSPNPVSNQLKISVDVASDYFVSIISGAGQQVISNIYPSSKNMMVNTESLSYGVYTLVLQNKITGAKQYKRFVK